MATRTPAVGEPFHYRGKNLVVRSIENGILVARNPETDRDVSVNAADARWFDTLEVGAVAQREDESDVGFSERRAAEIAKRGGWEPYTITSTWGVRGILGPRPATTEVTSG